MTDQDHVDAVKQAVSALNDALRRACNVGLRVEVERKDVLPPAAEGGTPIPVYALTAAVRRTVYVG